MDAKQAYAQASELYSNGAYAEAAEILRELNDRFPHNKNLMFALAQCLEKLGGYAEALALCDELIARSGDLRAGTLRQQILQSHPDILRNACIAELSAQASGFLSKAPEQEAQPEQISNQGTGVQRTSCWYRPKLVIGSMAALVILILASVCVLLAGGELPEPGALNTRSDAIGVAQGASDAASLQGDSVASETTVDTPENGSSSLLKVITVFGREIAVPSDFEIPATLLECKAVHEVVALVYTDPVGPIQIQGTTGSAVGDVFAVATRIGEIGKAHRQKIYDTTARVPHSLLNPLCQYLMLIVSEVKPDDPEFEDYELQDNLDGALRCIVHQNQEDFSDIMALLEKLSNCSLPGVRELVNSRMVEHEGGKKGLQLAY